MRDSQTGRRGGQDKVRTSKESERSKGHLLSGERRGRVRLRNRASERHSRPGEHQWRVKSRHGKKVSEVGHSRTGGRKELQLRTPKEREPAKGTHKLESTKVQFRTTNESERGALTSWRVKRERRVRTSKERLRKENSLPGGAQREGNFRTSKESERGALTNWRAEGRMI